jgi:signal transduction histidine kinase
MTPEVMRRAFDPLFTTKPAQKGTGLGLWICQCTMTNHEGTISLRSVLGEGTEIVLAFPCAGTSPPDR